MQWICFDVLLSSRQKRHCLTCKFNIAAQSTMGHAYWQVSKLKLMAFNSEVAIWVYLEVYLRDHCWGLWDMTVTFICKYQLSFSWSVGYMVRRKRLNIPQNQWIIIMILLCINQCHHSHKFPSKKLGTREIDLVNLNTFEINKTRSGWKESINVATKKPLNAALACNT